MVRGCMRRMSPAFISGEEKGRREWPRISCVVRGPCLWELGQSFRAPSKKVQSSRERRRERSLLKTDLSWGSMKPWPWTLIVLS